MSRYLMLDDDTVWPDPAAVDDLEWKLRYSAIDRADALVLASVCAAYVSLTTRPSFKRKPIMIRRAMERREG